MLIASDGFVGVKTCEIGRAREAARRRFVQPARRNSAKVNNETVRCFSELRAYANPDYGGKDRDREGTAKWRRIG